MTEGLRSIVALSKESLRGIEPAPIDDDELPTIEWLDPRELFIEEAYQREVGEAGTGLIRTIYSKFSWARFKPPIAVRRDDIDGVLVCIDGQHTAIAAACHPKIKTIPVMIVKATTSAERASAFVGHNRDRVSLTPQMIYFAELQAGDELAVAVDAACKASGAFILPKAISLKSKQPPGATVAIGTMKVIVKRRGADALADALRILVAVGRGPIKADEIAACSIVLGYGGIADKLRELIATRSAEQWAALAIGKAAESREPVAAAMASIWCRELGIRISGKSVKAGRGAVRLMDRPPPEKKPEPQFDHAARLKREIVTLMSEPQPASKPQPAKPVAPVAPLPKQPQPKTEPIRQPAAAGIPAPVSRNGVNVDFLAQKVEHRGGAVALPPDALTLVAALVNVMPALLDGKRVASRIYGSHADGPIILRGLINQTNPALARVNLEIRTVKNIGHCLADTAG